MRLMIKQNICFGQEDFVTFLVVDRWWSGYLFVGLYLHNTPPDLFLAGKKIIFFKRGWRPS